MRTSMFERSEQSNIRPIDASLHDNSSTYNGRCQHHLRCAPSMRAKHLTVQIDLHSTLRVPPKVTPKDPREARQLG